MQEQAPAPQALPPETQQQASPSDGVGSSKESTALLVASKNADIDARRRAIVEAARAALKAEQRQASPAGPAPVAPAPTPTAPATAPATPANPSALAEAFMSQLEARTLASQQAQAEAQRMRAEGDARAAAAEAKLQQFIDNPTSYLQSQGKTLDDWQARLANGGEPTEFEKLEAKLRKEVEAKVAPLAQELQQYKAREFSQVEAAAIADANRILPKEFPLVHHFLGSQGAIDELKRQATEARQKGLPLPDGQKALAAMEAFWEARTKGALQDPNAAAKVGVSAKSPPGTVAAPSPSTLTNRVTSSVPAAASRARNEAERIARGREQIKQLAAEKRI